MAQSIEGHLFKLEKFADSGDFFYLMIPLGKTQPYIYMYVKCCQETLNDSSICTCSGVQHKFWGVKFGISLIVSKIYLM